ncbi:MAG: RES family NAD+ phosphorylase [Alphaproteobacteria bacterium]|nr:RES family NAD+ phosphorylase [Alphaproteobacteria bacterium]
MRLWQQLKGFDFITLLDKHAFRIVENQYNIATRKLVDNTYEHDILEAMIDGTKPYVATHNKHGKLHWLLFTPFRYPPLLWGSRFGKITEPSLFYASLELETAMAEVSFRQFIHLNASEASFEPTDISFTHIKVAVATNKALHLEHHPFDPHRNIISDPTSYAISQPLGTDMREYGIEAFTYFSARKKEGLNLAIFYPDVFAKNAPLEQKLWSAFVSKSHIEFRNAYTHHLMVEFPLSDFLVDGKLPLVY